jgi:hypothetical protein
MQFLEEMPAEKEKANFINYFYYITGVIMDGKPYTILSVVGKSGDEIYYDQNVFEGAKREVFIKAKKAAYDDYKYSRLNKILANIEEGDWNPIEISNPEVPTAF